MNETSSEVEASLIEQHYSTRIYKGYIAYLNKCLGQDETRILIQKTGLSLDYLNKESNWVSELFADRFYEAIKSDPRIPSSFSHDAGRYLMSKEGQGTVHLIAMQLLDPRLVFKQVQSFTSKFNKVDTIKIKSLGANRVVLEFRSNRKSPFFREILDNWAGILEGIPLVYNAPSGTCTVTTLDSQTATFDVRWNSNPFYLLLRRIQIFSGFFILGLAITLFLSIFAWIATSLTYLIIAIFGSITVLFGASLLAEIEKRKLLESTPAALNNLIAETEEKYKELIKNKANLDRRYKESQVLAKVLQQMTSSQNTSELVQVTLKEIKERLQYDRVVYMGKNLEKNILETVASQGFSIEQEQIIHKYKLDLNEVTSSKMHLGNVFKERRSILIPVTSEYSNSLSSEGQTLLKFLNSYSFMICTVATESRSYGLLLVDYVDKTKTLDQDDLTFIQNIAGQLAICLDKGFVLETERSMRATFQRFVPDQVIRSMLGEGDTLIQSGKTQNVTVLLSDIRNFTHLTSEFDPNLMVKSLNHYFEKMTEIVYRHGGIVDKFIGDSILAYFNAFGDIKDHQEQAVHAAYEMLSELPTINQNIHRDLFKNGKSPTFQIGIGLHTGDAILGNIGSKHKMEYTIIGDTVNIAQRIENESRNFPNSILLSEELATYIQNSYELSSLGQKQLKGIDQPKHLFLLKTIRNQSSSHQKKNGGNSWPTN